MGTITFEALEKRRDAAKAAAEAVCVSPSDVGEDAGNAIAEGAASGIVREAEYRLLTDAEARARVLGGPLASATSNGPGFILSGGTLMPAPAGVLADIDREGREAMAMLDRNFAENGGVAS